MPRFFMEGGTVKRLFSIFLFVFMAFLLVHSAGADEIWLKNGDRLSGKIIGMEKKEMVFSTSYAGQIKINWDEVVKFRTDEAVSIELGPETRLKGIIAVTEDGKLQVQSQGIEGTARFETSKVQAINPAPPAPAVTLSGSINAGVTITEGNTETESIYVDAELVARTSRNRVTLGGIHREAREDEDKTADNTTVYMKYDYFLTEKWYLLATGTGVKDKFKDLNLRSTAGLGLGYQFFDTPLTKLAFEAGLSYVNDDYKVAEDKDYMAGRWAANFSHHLIKDRLMFFHGHEGLVSLEDADDIFIRSKTGLRLPIVDKLNATLQLNYDWDNSPAEGKKRDDTAYILTLGYAW
jgi:putative salt-induced outer membrane protein YdiY